tara:strand:+ start:310 stop:822 length:513 start_codon:yes stop_codon:yes gene_type:complete
MIIKKYKNIFLDRDGIINNIVLRERVISSPRSLKEFKLREDFINFANNVNKKAHNFFICTNQPDIARKLLKLDDLHEMHKVIEKYLDFSEILYCSHDDSEGCNCRKPKPGMINLIIDKHELKKEECVMIGDSKKDILSAKSAKIDAYYMNTTYNASYKHTHNFNNLMDLI